VTWAEAFDELGLVVSRAGLLAAGASGRDLTAAVRGGQLIRVRRDHYALPQTPSSIIRSVRIGGRIGCLSALAHAGVFAIDTSSTHAHVDRRASRLRPPDNRRRPLTERRAGVVVHWSELIDPDDGTEFSVGMRDALAQVVRCQEPRYAIASIDSALHVGAIDEAALRELFARLPERYSALLDRVDGRAEAGQETVLRLAIEDAGFHCELQVYLDGVGRVDMVVEGCLVVEADSRLAHDGWELHVRDRNRDIDAARLGYPTLRPAYQRTIFATDDVVEAVRGLLLASRNFRVHL
jgi:hypothetical protein